MSKKFAFIFPGQGSQTVGMLAELAGEFPVVLETFAEASAVLGYDLWEVVQDDPAETLNRTDFTQPAMLAADIAVYRCWQTLTDAQPALVAGHSLGEYAALVVAGSLSFSAAIALVEKRGRYMLEAVPEGVGAMAAIIGLDDQMIEAVCETAANDEVVSPANFNSIGQTVIAGHHAAVLRAIDEAKAQGAKMAKLIPVSVPSHCLLMEPAAKQLADDFKAVEFKSPTMTVLHNVDMSSHTSVEALSDVLVSQLVSPVRWVETIQVMQAEGIEVCVECGPGRVLAGLVKRIDRSLPVMAAGTPEALKEAVTAVAP